jgi:hypothetical protein
MADNCGEQIKVATLKVVNYEDCVIRLKLKPIDGSYINDLKLASLTTPHLQYEHVGGSSKDVWVDFNEDVYGNCEVSLKHVLHFLDLLQSLASPFYIGDNLDTKQLKSRLFDCELTQIKLSLYSSGTKRNFDYPVLTIPNRIMVSAECESELNIGVWLQGPHLNSENKARVFEKYSRVLYTLGDFIQNHYFDNDTISFNFPNKDIEYLGEIVKALSSISANISTEFSSDYNGPKIGENQSVITDEFTDDLDESKNLDLLKIKNLGYVNLYFDSFI